MAARARRMWPVLTGICAGTAIGVALLPKDDGGRATVWLGLVKGKFSVPRQSETWLGLLMGTATGAITVATGIFVMPGTPYLQALSF